MHRVRTKATLMCSDPNCAVWRVIKFYALFVDEDYISPTLCVVSPLF